MRLLYLHRERVPFTEVAILRLSFLTQKKEWLITENVSLEFENKGKESRKVHSADRSPKGNL